MNNFTANDIKAGYLGVLKNGEKAIAMPYDNGLTFVNVEEVTDRGAVIECTDAFNLRTCDDYRLVALYGYPKNYDWFSTENRSLLWERKPIEMTIAETEAKLGIEKLKIIKEY